MGRLRIALRAALLAVGLCGAVAAPSAAAPSVVAPGETAVVRSGEHDGFSRLVVTLALPVKGWRFGRLPDGYQLRVGRAVQFDLSEVFARIPRSRLADISADDARGWLSLQLACACHAEVFAFRPNILVIDIRPGGAKANSPFEKKLQEAQVAPRTSPSPEPRPAAPIYAWREVAQPALPTPYIPDLAMPAAPDPTVAKARAALLRQLARAGAQGLVRTDPRQLRLAGQAVGNGPPEAAAPVAEAQADTRPSQAGAGRRPSKALNAPGIRAMTVMDRDAPQEPASGLAAQGRQCPPDADFDLAAWGKPGAPGPQIGAARRAVVAEFDRARPEAVAALAKLYLRFGFGAEARQAFRAFDVTPGQSETLRALGAIEDGDHPGLTRPLAGFAACDGAVAMWSMLADPPPAAGAPVNTRSVIRTFSALPLDLRRLLGPRLSDVFLARHDGDTAATLRDAIVRAPGDPGDAVRLLGARLDLARGKAGEAAATIDRVVADAGPATPEAMTMLIDAKVARREPVNHATVEGVAALAHEYRGTPLGVRLGRAHVLALGLAGEFHAAFELVPGREGGVNTHREVPELWAILAGQGSDEAVVQNGLVPPEGPVAPETRLKMARRLVSLGFDQAADAWLETGQTPEAARRLLRARAALGQRDGRRALRVLAGASDPASTRLRARAYDLLGDYGAAGAAYAAIGASALQGAEAWRAGDWQEASMFGTKAQKAALVLALQKTAAPPAPEGGTPSAKPVSAGPLARGKALVEASRRARARLGALLAETAPAIAAQPPRSEP